jgi:hypothetical protein
MRTDVILFTYLRSVSVDSIEYGTFRLQGYCYKTVTNLKNIKMPNKNCKFIKAIKGLEFTTCHYFKRHVSCAKYTADSVQCQMVSYNLGKMYFRILTKFLFLSFKMF